MRLPTCAGSSQSAVAEETTQDIGSQVLRLNAEACLAVGRVLLRTMLERGGGHLVPIASMAGVVPSPGQAEYAAAKHAVRGYFASVAAEMADRNVAVTVACPGPIDGAASRTVFGAKGRVEKVEGVEPSKKKVPAERCCQLICDAAAHGLPEAWIARHPVLAVAYLRQYAPALATALLARAGPKRARALSEGRSGYDVQGFLSSKQK
jgi:dehydrogenase/reductase SDR family member 7